MVSWRDGGHMRETRMCCVPLSSDTQPWELASYIPRHSPCRTPYQCDGRDAMRCCGQIFQMKYFSKLQHGVDCSEMLSTRFDCCLYMKYIQR